MDADSGVCLQPDQGLSDAGAVPSPTRSGRLLKGALFDFSFREFLTTKLVKFVYGLQLVLIGLWSLFALAAGCGAGFGYDLLGLVAVPILALVGAMMARMFSELMIIVFRGVELLGAIEANQRDAASHTAAGALQDESAPPGKHSPRRLAC
jgi:hypothetical protein